jgi:hypothetical protein
MRMLTSRADSAAAGAGMGPGAGHGRPVDAEGDFGSGLEDNAVHGPEISDEDIPF